MNRTDTTDASAATTNRRSLLSLGAAASAVMAAGAIATGAAVTSSPAEAQTVTDNDILNFALNLEYLEGEYYSRGFLGRGLDAADRDGVGGSGFVLGGSQVPFRTPAIAGAVQRIVLDEVDHIRFLRRVLGAAAVGAPNIDLLNSFNALAVAAGLIPAGTQFNPFADEISFLLGAFILTDVGVTAYAGSARLLTNPNNIDAAAGLLATEAYHAGAIRFTLDLFNQQIAGNAISTVRARLSNGKDSGLSLANVPFNIANVDSDGLTFRRTSAEVLNVVYNGVSTGGGFLPNRANGTIR
ncbi:MAG TPA: ferritin-like domain-containing protein [Acetobacteraceae bacterium]